MNTYIVKYSCNCQENDGKQVYGYMYIKHSILNLYASRVLQILTFSFNKLPLLHTE